MFRIVLLLFGLIVSAAAHAGPLHEAAAEGNVARVRQLLAAGADINLNDALLGTPLHGAAVAGQAEVVELLVAEGADVNRTGGMLGLTPLQLAVASSARVTALLLAGGAGVNVADIEGNTPLHMAAGAGKIEVVALLLNNGANVAALNANGFEPIEFAGAADHFDVVELLLAHGALPSEPLEPVSDLLAKADPNRGAGLFRSTGCSHCHDIGTGDGKAGPNLRGIVGREKARQETFEFSEALKRVGGTWTYEELNAWLASPKRFAPGNRMSMAPLKVGGVTGVSNIADRADIIAYLRLQHDNPPPLPH